MKTKALLVVWAVVSVGLLADFVVHHFIKEVSAFYKQIEFIDCSGSKFAADDGDSLYCNGQYFRIMGLDAPETIHTDHGVLHNQKYGKEAREFALDIFRRAKKITVVHQIGQLDKYKRMLGHVLVDGHLFAPKMIRAGLAYEMIEYYGDQGFSEYAAEIMLAWSEVTKPLPFTGPHDFRQCEQKGNCTAAALADRILDM